MSPVNSHSDGLGSEAARARLRDAIEKLLGGTLVCFATLRIFVSGEFAGFGLNLFIAALFVFSVLLAAVLAAIDGKITFLRSAPVLLLFLFAAALLASPFVADCKLGALNCSVAWLAHVGIFLLLVSLAVAKGGSEGPVRFAYCALFATAVSVAVVGLLQWLFGFAEMQREIARNPAALDFLPAPLLHEFHVRLFTNEPFACFANPNSLAGFLVLFIAPFLVLAGSRPAGGQGAGTGRVLARIWLCFLSVLLALVLAFTGSKGGLGAFFISMLVLFVALRIRARRTVLVVLACLGLCFVVTVLALIQFKHYDPFGLTDPWSSMGVRMGYWKAAARIVVERPLLGVGLDNFAGHFLRLKDALIGETIRAHNDYLGIAAELGIPAALVFIAFWLILVWRALKPEKTKEGAERGRNLAISPPLSQRGGRGGFLRQAVQTRKIPPGPPLEKGGGEGAPHFFDLHPIGGGAPGQDVTPASADTAGLPRNLTGCVTASSRAAILYCLAGGLVGWLLTWTFQPTVMLAYGIPQLVAWLATFLACNFVMARMAAGHWRLLKLGMVAGLCGLLAHSFMEFNFYVHGIAMAAWMLAAKVYADTSLEDGHKPAEWSPSFKTKALLVVVPLALFLYITWSLVPRQMDAEAGIEWAAQNMQTREKQPNEILARLKHAAEICPDEARVWQLLAIEMHSHACSNMEKDNARAILEEAGEEGTMKLLRSAFDTCSYYARRATEVDPTASKLQYLRGVYEAEHAATLLEYSRLVGGEARVTLEKAAAEREKCAFEALREACRLYPTNAESRRQYGLALERAGRVPEAITEYHEALDLHYAQKLQRLRLEEQVVLELEKKVKGH